MIKLSKQGTLKAKEKSKPMSFLYHSQVVDAKEKFFKEMKSASPVNTQMIRKPKQPYCCYGESWQGCGCSSRMTLGVQDPIEEGDYCRCGGKIKKTEVEPEAVTELLQSSDKT